MDWLNGTGTARVTETEEGPPGAFRPETLPRRGAPPRRSPLNRLGWSTTRSTDQAQRMFRRLELIILVKVLNFQ